MLHEVNKHCKNKTQGDVKRYMNLCKSCWKKVTIKGRCCETGVFKNLNSRYQKRFE